jgi:molecular chaperone HtpG
MSKDEQIPFLVETDRILEILSKQIYDSPYAMVRENIQNAYDAILMRSKREGKDLQSYSIRISATEKTIEIQDDGIGMSEQILRDNFWRAGSSGKNNLEAKSAGVIGTFGIGAMANFGVCSQLIVETRETNSLISIRTLARKDELTIGGNCIHKEVLGSEIAIGTKIIATLDGSLVIDHLALKNYILPFVAFVYVPIYFNGELLSKKDPKDVIGLAGEWKNTDSRHFHFGRFGFDIVLLTQDKQFGVTADNLTVDGVPCSGTFWLKHQGGQIMGLRSRFGLAPIPISGIYQLGGYADLPFIFPTAGREALTRESIDQASQILSGIEVSIAEIIKELNFADNLPAFQQHILQIGKIEWAGKIKVQVQPDNSRVELSELREKYEGKDLQWYGGTDSEVITTFSNEDKPLVRLSQNNPRREVQQRYLTQILEVPMVPDAAGILESYEASSLTEDEFWFTFAVAKTLRNDYLFSDVEVEWAKISHGVPLLADMKGDKLVITISRFWPALQALLKVVEKSPEMLDAFTKDLVRVHFYPRIQSFVPSSQRAGLDALQRSLERKKELYRLELDDRGELEPFFSDYLSGKIDLGHVLSAATMAVAGQTQQVAQENVGSIETVLADVVNAPVEGAASQVVLTPTVGASIRREDTFIQERLLTTGAEFSQLNNYCMFLALSDKLVLQSRDFFEWPHSTQVAWAGRRIVYLFGLANSTRSLYYDIELKGNKSAGDAGGTALVTTTILANNRVFIPVPRQLMDCFQVVESPIEFYVRFDFLTYCN